MGDPAAQQFLFVSSDTWEHYCSKVFTVSQTDNLKQVTTQTLCALGEAKCYFMISSVPLGIKNYYIHNWRCREIPGF